MNKENKTATASLPNAGEIYEAPAMRAIEVDVEQGFVASGPAGPGDGDGPGGPGDGGTW